MLLRAAYRLGARLTRALPAGPRYGISGAAGAAWWTLDRGRRPAVLANYAAAIGRSEHDPEAGRTAARAFRNYGRVLADFLLMGSLTSGEVRERLSIDGREHADDAVAAGRGAILAMPHMGSWDFAGLIASIWGIPVIAVADRFPGSLNEAVVKMRSSHGLEVIPLGRSAVRAINRALDANILVALLCDLPPAGGGVEVELLGKRALLAAGPAAIACKRGVPILPAFARACGPGRYHIHVDPPIHPEPESCRGKTGSAALMQTVADRLSTFIRGHPDQWYAFKRVVY